MKNLWNIIYVSIATKKFNKEEILEILDQSRSNNEKLNVTGVLLYDGHVFFQVLEGEEHTISKIYQKICKDKRTKDVKLIIKKSIESRNFPEWTMGFKEITKKELNQLPGVNDFFKENKFIYHINPEIANAIVTAFSLKE